MSTRLSSQVVLGYVKLAIRASHHASQPPWPSADGAERVHTLLLRKCCYRFSFSNSGGVQPYLLERD